MVVVTKYSSYVVNANKNSFNLLCLMIKLGSGHQCPSLTWHAMSLVKGQRLLMSDRDELWSEGVSGGMSEFVSLRKLSKAVW